MTDPPCTFPSAAASAAARPPATASAPGVTHRPRSSRPRSGCSLASALERLAGALADGFWRELVLTPKPGLVDLDDAGSHPDLSFALMERSVQLVGEYLAEVARSLGRREPLRAQVALARAAEQRLLDRFGANTHKGALFLGGVVLAARARAASDDACGLRLALALVARDLEPLLAIDRTHGAAARARFGVGGILHEVAAGLPSVFEAALPAFRTAVGRGEGGDAPSFRMLASLMRTVDDTTALHRCGAGGLAALRADGARLDAVLDLAGAPGAAEFLRARNAAYRSANLTMGGVADLLGVAYAWLAWRGELGGEAVCPGVEPPGSLRAEGDVR